MNAVQSPSAAKTIRFLSLFLAVLTLLVTFPACGKGDASDTPDAAPDAPAVSGDASDAEPESGMW